MTCAHDKLCTNPAAYAYSWPWDNSETQVCALHIEAVRALAAQLQRTATIVALPTSEAATEPPPPPHECEECEERQRHLANQMCSLEAELEKTRLENARLISENARLREDLDHLTAPTVVDG